MLSRPFSPAHASGRLLPLLLLLQRPNQKHLEDGQHSHRQPRMNYKIFSSFTFSIVMKLESTQATCSLNQTYCVCQDNEGTDLSLLSCRITGESCRTTGFHPLSQIRPRLKLSLFSVLWSSTAGCVDPDVREQPAHAL